jgi:hypothetical protein
MQTCGLQRDFAAGTRLLVQRSQRMERIGSQGRSALDKVILHQLAPVSNLAPVGRR